MTLTAEKRKQAAEAVSAANPRWSERHVRYCVEIMPTPVTYAFTEGSWQEKAAEQHHLARLHAWLVEMNLMAPEAAFTLPDDWVSPFDNAPVKRQQRVVTPRGTDTSTPDAPRVTADIKEPRAGSAGAKAWAICDTLYTKHGRVPTATEAGEAAQAAGLNPGNVKTEVSRWRKFRGYQK